VIRHEVDVLSRNIIQNIYYKKHDELVEGYGDDCINSGAVVYGDASFRVRDNFRDAAKANCSLV
jgi:hypothetical protein